LHNDNFDCVFKFVDGKDEAKTGVFRNTKKEAETSYLDWKGINIILYIPI